MHIRHGLTAATLGILGAVSVFVGCKSSPGGAAPTTDGGVTQNVSSGAQQPPTCTATCTTAQDCGAGSGLEDASHFQCLAGRCQWQGCKSKADCTAAFQTDNVICVKEGGAPVPGCVHTCTVPADCAGQTAADDASHYQCNGGRCQWQGCKSNAECAAAFKSDKFVCSKEGGAPVAACVIACDTPTDCAPPGGQGPDVSRFTCNNHRCAWLGCASTAECKALYHSDKVICE